LGKESEDQELLMKDSDWYYRDEDDDFGEAVHRRTEELYKVPDASLDSDGLIECPVLPLRDLVIYPHMVAPVFVGREASLLAIEEAQMDNHTVIALTQRDSTIDNPKIGDFLTIGVEVAVGRLVSMPDGSSSALAQGRRRLEVIEFSQHEPFMVARARPLYETTRLDREIDATMRTALELFQKCVQLNRSLPDEAYLYALNIEEPGWLADMIVTTISPPMEERLKLLQMLNPSERLKYVVSLLAQEADVLELEDQIHTKAQSEVDRTQREFYLREQMRIIQTELGEADTWVREISDLRKRVEGIGLPEEVMLRALKEIDRLNQMMPMSPEVGIIRTYIDWILDLPWTNATEDNLDVKHAADTLEQYHYGLPRTKTAF
jgi:ATP-dependent Lon protease